MLKTILMGIALAAAGIGAAFADRAGSEYPGQNNSLPAECLVSVAAAPGYLPRAGLTVENRGGRAIRVWLEGRHGSGLERTEIGTVGAFDRRFFRHALPAGRNLLTASVDAKRGETLRQVVTVANRGPDTCTRRYLWQPE
jgi:hypothetical protein